MRSSAKRSGSSAAQAKRRSANHDGLAQADFRPAIDAVFDCQIRKASHVICTPAASSNHHMCLAQVFAYGCSISHDVGRARMTQTDPTQTFRMRYSLVALAGSGWLGRVPLTLSGWLSLHRISNPRDGTPPYRKRQNNLRARTAWARIRDGSRNARMAIFGCVSRPKLVGILK